MNRIVHEGMFFDHISRFQNANDETLPFGGRSCQFHLAGTEHVQTDTGMAFIKHDLIRFIEQRNFNALKDRKVLPV